MQSDAEILFGIVIFLSILGFISAFLPSQFQILSSFDFLFLSGSIIGVAGACVIITGGACAVALGVFGFANLFLYFIVPITFEFVKPLIIVPITLVITYIVARLGRGGS